MTEPPRVYRILPSGERVWLAYRIEAQTPHGWVEASCCASFLYAFEKVRTRDGLSRAVPAYRIVRGGEVMFGPA